MIVVTALAVCGGLGLAYIAVGAAHDADAAQSERSPPSCAFAKPRSRRGNPKPSSPR